jgi:hypothetical protein
MTRPIAIDSRSSKKGRSVITDAFFRLVRVSGEDLGVKSFAVPN